MFIHVGLGTLSSAALASQIMTRMSATDATFSAIRFSLAGLGKAAAWALAATLLNLSSASRALHLFAIMSAGG